MLVKDARSLSREAQVDLRKRVVHAVVDLGMKQRDAAKLFSVGIVSVCNWVNRYRDEGEASLEAKPKGPKPGSGALLTTEQSQEIRNLIVDQCPEQLKLPFALWTRESIRDLIQTRLGITMAIRTVGDYLHEWGFTPQKPVRRAYEQSPAAVQKWLDETYPSIAKRAKEEGATIYWGDEMGLRSDHSVGRSYGLRGQTPVIPATGKRFSCSMISALTNQGSLSFKVFTGTFTSKTLIDFCRRLIKQAGQQNQHKVFLILDGHPVHRSNVVRAWAESHKTQIELFCLPAYSPELNPDELLNQDVKTNVSRHGRPLNVQHLMTNLRCYLFSTQKRPDVVRNFFKEKHVKYALPESI